MSYSQHTNNLHQKPPPRIRFEMQQNQPRAYATGPAYQNQRPQNPQNLQRLQQHSQHPLQMVQQAPNQPHVVRGMAPQQMGGSYMIGTGPGPNGTMVVTYPHLQPGMNIAPGQHQYRFHQIPQPNYVYGTPPANMGYGQVVIQHHQQMAAAGANASYMNTASYHHQNVPAQNAVPVPHHAAQYYAAPMHQQQYVRAQPIQAVPQVQQVAQQQPQQPHQVHHQVHQQQQQQQQPMQQSVQAQGQHAQQAEHREHAQHQPPPQQYNSQPRKRRILNIMDPQTGKPVIQDDGEPTVSVSPQPTVEQVGTNDGGFISIEETQSGPVVAASLNASPTPEEDPGKPVSVEETPPEPGEGVKKVKEEFFRLITRSADDSDGRSSSNSTSESVPVPNTNVPVPSSSTGPVVESSPAPVTPLEAPTAPEPEIPPVVPSTPQVVPPQGELVIITPPQLMKPLETLTPSPSQTVSPTSVETDELDQSLTDEPENTSYVNESHLSYENETPQKMMNSGNLSVVSGGGGDDLTEASLVSISPIPIEKYVQDTPEKPSPAPKTVESSGEPSSVDSSTRESTLSPSFPTLSKEETPEPKPSAPSTLFTKMEGTRVEISPPVIKRIIDDKPSDVNRITESLEKISIILDEPAQTEETLVNGGGGAEPRVEQNYEELEDQDQDEEDLEEGELGEADDGDEDTPEASGEPAQKRRVVYDRALLMDLKGAGSKDAPCINSIPLELRSDGRPMTHAGPSNFGRMGNSPGSFNRLNMGPPQGLRRDDRRDNKPGSSMNRMGMGQQWSMGGLGQPMAVPPMLRTAHAPKIIDLHRGEVGLHKAENAWKPSVATARHGRGGGNEEPKDEEELIIADVVKKTRGILNKLTPENFEKLVQKFLQLNLEDKDERIGAVIHVVFEKAIDEPSFSTAYAKMVHTICQRSAETSKKFRKKILDQCQQEFQQGNTEEENIRALEAKLEEAEEDKKAQIKLELDEKKYGSRRRSLGNVRFIGELYKLQMLTPKIMVECVNMLLVSHHDEESLECLCKLLTTIGQKLDNNLREHEANNAQMHKEKKAPKWIPEPRFMDNTFKKLRDLSVDKILSSRIRFALLDVYELRESGWKPRRDMNAPKTIDEVRRAALREEQEEKKQLMNLPPAQLPPRLPPSQQQNKKSSDWNTVQSNKSSRFTVKKPNPAPEASGGLPIFAPSGGWGMGGRPGAGMNSNQQTKTNLPPRFQTRFSVLDQDRMPAPPPSRDDIVQPPPPSHRTSTSSHNSSRESSRPQTPTRDSQQSYQSAGRQQSESPAPRDIKVDHTADAPETVKNIFLEFVSVRKWEDTVDWILSRFSGEKIIEFVDELSRQVCDMSKEEHQKTAGSLIKMLVKKELTSKAQVIETLKNGVILEMPDIEVDVPKVTSYLASFLVELFFEEEDLAWLVPLGEGIEDDFASSWEDLVKHTLNILKLRRSEEAVQVLYKKTQKANRLPTQEMPWITGDTVESFANKMKAVLEKSDNVNVSLLLSENSWDIREELTIRSLIEAICRVSWTDGTWNSVLLEKLFPQIRIPSSKLYPPIWRQAKEFIKRNNINKDDEEHLWQVMLKHKLITKDSQAEV